MIEGLVAGGARAAARRQMAMRQARRQALVESGWACPHCRARRAPEEQLPGSWVMQILLFAFIFPAISYWNWRWKNRWYACPACSQRVEPPAWFREERDGPTAAADPAAEAAPGSRCPRCGTADRPSVRRRGSTALHVLLYFAWILPGILYGMWRQRGVGQVVCSRCGLDLGPAPIP